MELFEDKVNEKYGNQCKHCLRKTLHPYDYECTCIALGYNVMKQKTNLVKTQG